MRLFTSARWTGYLQFSCVVVMGISVMLTSFQLLAQANGKERPHELPDFSSHDTGRWALHFLQRGRPERRSNDSLAARAALFVANVRAALCAAFRSLSPGRARLPWVRTQRLARPEAICVYVRSLRRHHES